MLGRVFWIIFAHFLADFPLQGEYLAREKCSSYLILAAHCMIYTGVLAAALVALKVLVPWKVCLLFVTHVSMDQMKCRFFKSSGWGLWVDQAYHILIAILVVLC